MEQFDIELGLHDVESGTARTSLMRATALPVSHALVYGIRQEALDLAAGVARDKYSRGLRIRSQYIQSDLAMILVDQILAVAESSIWPP